MSDFIAVVPVPSTVLSGLTTGLDWWPLVTEDSRLDRLYPSNLTHRKRSAGFCRRACRHKKKRSSACAPKMFSPCIFGEGRCLWFTRSWFDSGSDVMTRIFFFANIWVMVTDLPFLFEVQHRGHAWGLESDHMIWYWIICFSFMSDMDFKFARCLKCLLHCLEWQEQSFAFPTCCSDFLSVLQGMAIEVYTGHGWLSSRQSWVDIAEFFCNLNVFLRSFHDVSRPDSVLHQCLVEIAVAHSVVQTHLLTDCGQLSRWSCTRDVSSASDQLRNFFKFSRTFADFIDE